MMASFTRVKLGERFSWSRKSSERKMRVRMVQYLTREKELLPGACWSAWYAGTTRQSNTFSRRLV